LRQGDPVLERARFIAPDRAGRNCRLFLLYNVDMRLSYKIKLLPDAPQKDALMRILETANAASNEASEMAFAELEFRKFEIHKLCYNHLRDIYGLPSQTAVRCVAKVADAYKSQKSLNKTLGRKELTVCRFGRRSALAFDDRNLRWRHDSCTVVITTMDGCLEIPYRCGNADMARALKHRAGESDLSTFNGKWYLTVTCEVEEPAVARPKDVLGVDLGVINIAADSDGVVWSGRAVNTARSRFRKMRKKLQKVGTRSAKRLLRKRSKRERRFARDINHCISKQIVSSAEGTQRAIAIEELGGIRRRTTVSRQQRAKHSSWAFAQLRFFIEYKAKLRGVAVIAVDPRNSSRTCPCCSHVSKSNRPSRDSFVCQSCGFSGPADSVAATIIADRGRAVVNQPNVTSGAPQGCRGQSQAPSSKGGKAASRAG